MTDHVEPKDAASESPPEEAQTTHPSEAPPTAETSSATPSVAEEHAAPAAEDADEGEQEPDVHAEGEEPSGTDEGKKKRRRRRRKKKKGAPGEGEAAEQEITAEPAKKKDAPHLPFQRFFDGAARRHAFSIGEIVAGRVVETREDLAVVDLFGKATAYTRLHEPREIPVAPVEEEPAEAEVEAAEAEVAEAEVVAPAEQAAAPDAALAAAELTEADAAVPEPAAEEAAMLEGVPEELDGEEAPPTDAAPVPEPAYVLHPEGVAPLEAGGIFRGRVGAVAESGHIALVNELVDVKATRAFLKHAKDARTRVPGLVFGFNRGGFDVVIYGLRAFCPVSGMTLEMLEDPEPLLGQWAQFHVQAAKGGAQGLVVSRRSILEKEARKRAKALLKSLEPGQTVRGRVTQVREYGLFVDIGGIEGLLHQSELSWERGVRPEDVAKVGDEIDVQVLKVHERESKRERYDRVSLSIKALQPDPWKEQVEQLVEGQPRKGTVVRTAEFGAFVQLAPGVDGLLHITELGRELKHADQAVSVGDEIYVVVERVDRKQHRISLSKLSTEEAEAFEKGELSAEAGAPRLKPGAHIKVRVTQVSPAGLQVQVENVVGRRGRGFIPNSEMGTPRGTDHRRQWPPGTEIDVTIIGTDRDGGLRCSRKRFLMDEERRAVREYRKEVAKQGLGTFADILRQKLGQGTH